MRSPYLWVTPEPCPADRAAMSSLLVTEGLPVVHQVVAAMSRRLPRSVERDELVAAGMLGLAQAARSFDPARGVPFTAHARTRVTGAVLDELRSRDNASRRVRSRARVLEAAASSLAGELGRPPTDEELCARTRFTRDDLWRLRADVDRAASMHRFYGTGPDDLVAALPSPDAGPEDRLLDAELKGYVADAVSVLPTRLRAAVVGYVCEGRPMKELAAELGVTESRVSQLCTEAIALLRDGINAQLEPAVVADRAVVTGRVSRRKAAYCLAVATASTTADRLDRRIALAA